MVSPTASHLGDTIDTPDEDKRIGTGDSVDKHAELLVGPQGERLGSRLSAPNPFLHPHDIVDRHDAEEAKDDHLQDDTGDDGAVAALEQLIVGGTGTGRDRAADSLDEQAGYIGRDENVRVQRRAHARQGRVERQADVLQGEIDGDADERRSQNNGDDLGLESVFVPWVFTERDSCCVTCGCDSPRSALQMCATPCTAMPMVGSHR